MTVLDQVLQAEKDSEAALAAAYDAAQKAVAFAESDKVAAITAAKEAVVQQAEIARSNAKAEVEKEASVIFTTAKTEAAAIKKAIIDKSDSLSQTVIDMFKNR